MWVTSGGLHIGRRQALQWDEKYTTTWQCGVAASGTGSWGESLSWVAGTMKDGGDQSCIPHNIAQTQP